MKTVSDARPIVRRNAPTIFAGRPIEFHISVKPNVMRVVSYAVRLNGIWMIRYTAIGCPL